MAADKSKLEEKKPTTIFLSKKEFVAGLGRSKYDFVEPAALKNINACKNDFDVLMMKVTTGSGLKVLDAQKVDELKFIQLTSIVEQQG